MLIVIQLSCAYFSLIGYRMAVECARNALLEKVVDNKQDTGNKLTLTVLSYLQCRCFISWVALFFTMLNSSSFPSFLKVLGYVELVTMFSFVVVIG